LIAYVVRVGGAKDVEQTVLMDGCHPVLPAALVGEVVWKVRPKRCQRDANDECARQQQEQGAVRAGNSAQSGGDQRLCLLQGL
jgi:hypothetical protein